MAEQKETTKVEEPTKEVITYIKTTTDEGVSVQQLAEDPSKLSIDDGRWVIDIPKKFAICLSEEFEQSAVSCTQLNKEEWGGFIVGHDIKWTNPDNQRQIRILIAERAIILGQTRTGASFEIKADVVDKWMSSDEDGDMAFMTVFGKNKWKKIGWVHSHGDLGVFWSTTDTDTMKDMRGVPMLLSMVYSRETGDKIDRCIRVDKNDGFFGGKFNMHKDKIEDTFVYNEGKVETIEDISEEIQEKYKQILNETVVISTTSHTAKTAKTTWATRGKTWYQQQADKYRQTTLPAAASTTEQLSKHTIVVGNLSEKAKEEIVEFGNFHYNIPAKDRKSLSIADFFILLDGELEAQMKPDGLYKKWKMKDIVALVDKQQILNIIAFYKNSEIKVQLALQAYHNFKPFSMSLTSLLRARLTKDALLEVEINDIAEETWYHDVVSSLEITEAIKLDMDDVEKVVEEAKPIPFMPTESFTNWADWYNILPKKYHEDFWDTLYAPLEEDKRKKMLERAEYAITIELRGDESEWVEYAVSTYENFVDAWKKTPKRYKESYRNMYTSFYRNAFKPYFSKYKYYSDKHSKLQNLMNALPEDYVKQFINDFICMYDTEEELAAIVEKFPKDYEVYRQIHACRLCGIEWLLKADADSCEEECKKRGKTTSKKVEEIEVDGDSKKETGWVEAESLTSLFGGQTTVDAGTFRDMDIVFGTTVKYYKGLNVCDLCGTLYDTQEAAELCETDCIIILEDVKEYFIDKDDVYECVYCKTQFFDDVPAVKHSESCPQYGTMLAYFMYLMTDSGHQPAQVVNAVNEFYINKVGSPPPLIDWMMEKGKVGNDIFQCHLCGVEHVAMDDIQERILQAFAHMNYCQSVKDDTVVSSGAAYRCGICAEVSYTFSTSEIELMQHHLYIRHGLYPTKEQLLKNMKKGPALTNNEYAGETVHAVLLVDGFCCKECGEKFVRPDVLLNHMTHTHTCVVLHGEYELWMEHDDDIEMLLFGALPTYSSLPKKKPPSEVVATENVNSYNGIFVCNRCDLTVGNITDMKVHILEKHEIHMAPDEELAMSDYEVRYNKQQEELKKIEISEEEAFVSLKDVYNTWCEDRAKSGSIQTECISCGTKFEQSDSDIVNIYDTFIHEVDCRKIATFGIEAYTCGLCGTLCNTIFEREICEMGHTEEV